MRVTIAGIAAAVLFTLATLSTAHADAGSSGRNAEPGFQAAANFFASFLASGDLIEGVAHADAVYVSRGDPNLDPLHEALDRMLARNREADRQRESEKAAEDLLQFTREVQRPDDYLPGFDD